MAAVGNVHVRMTLDETAALYEARLRRLREDAKQEKAEALLIGFLAGAITAAFSAALLVAYGQGVIL